MAMTIVFSIVIFSISSNQFDRPLPARNTLRSIVLENGGDIDIKTLLSQRAGEAKLGLFFSLVLLNTGMLAFGVWFSVYLARLTMEPIEKAMEEQSRFVSDASHELRTPLTAIQSMNEVALRRKKITEKEARELAEVNVKEAAKLHELTSSLLGLVAGAQKPTKLERLDLQKTVADAMSYIVTAAQKKHIAVDDNTEAVTVLANHEQLVHVVRILLDNAVKYSADGGTVRLASKQGAAFVRLSIIDAGIGIKETDIPHIFSRFYRADASRSKGQYEGYGLGLAIAKTISDRMDWNISVKSKPGKGSTFSIDLPVIAKN